MGILLMFIMWQEDTVKKICVFNTKVCQIAAQVNAQFTFNITVLINLRM